MPNQMIALQARGPQLPDIGVMNARYANMMGQMANMEKLRRESADAAAIRNVMSDPSFNPTDAASINKLIGLGPVGVEAASKIMQGQKLSGELISTKQQQAEKRVSLVGAGLVGLLRDPSDATLAQTAQTFKAVGMDPAEYEGVLAQISQIPDANQRKIFTLQFINQSEGARAALKFVMPDVKSDKVGDAQIYIDNNANSPTFGQELFRITASPEPVKLNQQVVEGTIYNVNPVTGVAGEATIGDPMASLIPGPRTLTRTDTGVVSPYAVGMGNMGLVTGERGPAPQAPPTEAPQAPFVSSRGPAGASSALQTNPGAIKDGAFARSQPGYTGAQGGYATFKTPEAGIAAQEKLLRSAYVGKGFNTIDKIVNKYAPQGPENSAASVANYKKYISQRTGIDIGAPISAAQVPAVAAAMREFETGNRPGGRPSAAAAAPTSTTTGAPPAPTTPTPGRTISDVQRAKAAKLVIPLIGYNVKTGSNAVSNLISASTSGGLEKIGSDVAGFFGTATSGAKAIGQLSTIKDNMTYEKLRGKLGAQISDADVRLIANTMGDIADASIPAEIRLAKWNNVVLPLLLRNAGLPPKEAIDYLRKNPNTRAEFDRKYWGTSAAEVLGR